MNWETVGAGIIFYFISLMIFLGAVALKKFANITIPKIFLYIPFVISTLLVIAGIGLPTGVSNVGSAAPLLEILIGLIFLMVSLKLNVRWDKIIFILGLIFILDGLNLIPVFKILNKKFSDIGYYATKDPTMVVIALCVIVGSVLVIYGLDVLITKVKKSL